LPKKSKLHNHKTEAMTIQAWLNHAAKQLKPVTDSWQLDAELLVAHELNLSRAQLLSNMDTQLTTKQLDRLEKDIDRRINGEPIAYIVGSIEFYGLTLSVDWRVLCPRPETETLVEHVIKVAPDSSRVVDVGTGSGAIAIALKTHRPDLSITASDISSDALTIAKGNIAKHELDIKAMQSSLLDNFDAAHVVVANLPYLPDNETLDKSVVAEPLAALVSGEDGLKHYRTLFEQAAEKLQITHIFIEAPPSQKDTLVTIAADSGFKLHWKKDYSFEFERV